MDLSAFVALWAGILIEILLLWEQAHPENAPAETLPGVPGIGRERSLMVGVGLVAALLIAAFELTGIGAFNVSLDHLIPFYAFVALGLLLFWYGIVDPKLLPHINEQTALAVHTVVLLGLYLGGEVRLGWPQLAGLGLLTLLLFYLVLRDRPVAPLVKVPLYLWYLLSLLLLIVQNDFIALVEAPYLSLAESFILGATGFFLLLQGLFLLRFILMSTSLLNPHGRDYMQQAMPQLFGDEDLPRWRLLVLGGLVVAVLVAHTYLELTLDLMAINLLVLGAVHWQPPAPR